MDVGVLSVQGAVVEHLKSLKKAADGIQVHLNLKKVRSAETIECLDGLIIPGGESSTISRLIDNLDLRRTITSRVEDGMQVMGTCAGSILLAKEGGPAVEDSDTRLLGLMDMKVERNAFGRQKDSFEYEMDIEGIATSFPAVFIRAPAITDCSGCCRPLGHIKDTIIAAEEKNRLALVFHPELTADDRVHRYFIEKMMMSR